MSKEEEIEKSLIEAFQSMAAVEAEEKETKDADEDEEDDEGKGEREEEKAEEKMGGNIEAEVDKNLFKNKVLKILTDSGFKEKRSSKLDIDDFLKLLHVFNESGIHFK